MNNLNQQHNVFTPAKKTRKNMSQLNMSKSPNGYTPVSPVPQDYEHNDENIPPNFADNSQVHFNESQP